MFPHRKDLFTKWSKAMVEGATVDKPNYSPVRKNKPSKKSSKSSHMKRRRRRKAKKDA